MAMDLKLPLLITVSTLLLQDNTQHCRILRDSCQHYASFTVKWNGSVLFMSVLSTFYGLTQPECKEKCIRSPPCKAVNFHKNGTCLISSETPTDPASNFSRKSLLQLHGWSFISTNFSNTLVGEYCMKNKPCGKHFCIDTCRCPGHKCIRCGTDISYPCPDGHKFLIRHVAYVNTCLILDQAANKFLRTVDCPEKYFIFNGEFLIYQSLQLCVGLFNGDGWLVPKSCGSSDTRWIREKQGFLWNARTHNCLYNHLPWIYMQPGAILKTCYEEGSQFKIDWYEER